MKTRLALARSILHSPVAPALRRAHLGPRPRVVGRRARPHPSDDRRGSHRGDVHPPAGRGRGPGRPGGDPRGRHRPAERPARRADQALLAQPGGAARRRGPGRPGSARRPRGRAPLPAQRRGRDRGRRPRPGPRPRPRAHRSRRPADEGRAPPPDPRGAVLRGARGAAPGPGRAGARRRSPAQASARDERLAAT